MFYHFTHKSQNRKVGPIPTTVTSAVTCPDACALKGQGCYAEGGPAGMHWRAVTEGKRGGSLDGLVKKIQALPDGQLWRHNVSGDLPGKGNRIAHAALAKLVKANEGKRGFTYTHKPMTVANQVAVADANSKGFTVNLSANNPAHADQLADLGIAPVATILPADQLENTTTPGGRKITICHAITGKRESCADCKLCQVSSPGRAIVGFPAHGFAYKRAQASTNNLIARG